jgi:NAD(P)-dependent dehydrogenase (short-subunit alcohol dehydrogenase family)
MHCREEVLMRSQPKTVVVTGASAGLGRAVVMEFARRGWRVGLIARGEERLEDARREVEAAGGEALVLPADVADWNTVEASADQAAQKWGGIDVWVNCAMTSVFSSVREMKPEEFRRVTEVTYLGYVHGTLAALKHMRPRNQGAIVQVGSALAYRAIPWQSAYCASKFAIRGFTDALRSELIHEGSAIRLSMVQAPAMNTPQFEWTRNRMPKRPQPVPPIFQPEVVAEAVYRAAMEGPRELWVGMPTVKTIVGAMAVPAYLDRLLARVATDGQMSDEPAREGREDNLFEPAPGHYGAHGRFDARSREGALVIEPERARKTLGLAGAAVGLGALAWAVARSTRALRR